MINESRCIKFTMQYYVENRLADLHAKGMESGIKDKVIASLFGIVITFMIPVLHLGAFYHMWSENKPPVDKQTCTCKCFDTIFRGKYEWPPSTYKHVYFNTTPVTLKIWVMAILGIVTIYEVSKRVVTLMKQKLVRWDMLALLASSIYPHYYGWWNFFQYLNEEFYEQWYHQMFFSITEAASSLIIIHLANSKNVMKPWKLLLVMNINLIHIIVSSLDQFISNVIYNRGQDFEILRDLGLMLPDVLHVLVAFFELMLLAEKKNKSVIMLLYREEIFMFLLLTVLLSILGKAL